MRATRRRVAVGETPLGPTKTDSQGQLTTATSAEDLATEQVLCNTLRALPPGLVSFVIMDTVFEGAAEVAQAVRTRMLGEVAVIVSVFSRDRGVALCAALVASGLTPEQARRIPVFSTSEFDELTPRTIKHVVIDRAHLMGSAQHAAWATWVFQNGVLSVDLVGMLTAPSPARGWSLAHVARCLHDTLAPPALGKEQLRALALELLGIYETSAGEVVATLGVWITACRVDAAPSRLIVRDMHPATEAKIRKSGDTHLAWLAPVGIESLVLVRDARVRRRLCIEDATLHHLNLEDWVLLLMLAWPPLVVIGNGDAVFVQRARAAIAIAYGSGERALAVSPED